MLHKAKAEMDNTDSRRVYNIARKRYLDGIGAIKCSYCEYQRGENAHKYQRSWKKIRKTRYKLDA